MESARFGEGVGRSKNDNKNIGICPQALISHFKANNKPAKKTTTKNGKYKKKKNEKND